MFSLFEHIAHCRQAISSACRRAQRELSTVQLVAASKTHDADVIREAFGLGIHNFGENYVQEWQTKRTSLQDLSDLQWHFIGHLQRNKVRFLIPGVSVIHSVDSFSLAKEISKESLRHGRSTSILFQVNTSGEDSKSGVQPDSLLDLVSECKNLGGIVLSGLMAIPEAQDDAEDVRPEFRLLAELRQDVQTRHSLEHFTELSMGMSSDFEVAIEEGATLVRLGTALFGERDYSSH